MKMNPVSLPGAAWRSPASFPWLATLLLGLAILSGPAAETLPPAPAQYFNDYAGVVSPGRAQQLNAQLQQFERDHSSQLLVAVFPKMQSSSSIEDYTFRLAEKWKVGRQGRDNGAVLFVFIEDRRMFIQVGYGLEGTLPDAVAKQIIDQDITPRFRNRDFEGGLAAGVQGLMAAARGEYQGTGRTVAESGRTWRGGGFILLFIIFFIVVSVLGRLRGGRTYRYGPGGGWTVGGGGFSSGRGSSWGGSRSGGGFSGGGGRFGGGGAGGGW